MKKIAICNIFQLPVPAVRGDVQQLTNALLEQNEITHQYEFDVYSPYNKQAVVEQRNTSMHIFTI
ncbi:MAG: hypothetical protein PHW34_00810 [Hespellia sp.]|nr:hypothetical protein [Hespellia sp.]